MGKKVRITIRVIFSLLLIAVGLFLVFGNAAGPPNSPERAASLLTALQGTGYFMQVVGLVQIAVGVLFLIGRYVALGALLLAPVSLNMLLFLIFLDIRNIIGALVLVILNIYIAYTEFEKYRPLLKAKL